MKTEIIYEDEAILVCRKPAGLATQTASGFQQDLVSELKNEISRRTGRKAPYLGVIHRLDQPVEGLLVFAKTGQAAAALTKQLSEGRLEKRYVAVMSGQLPKEQGVLTDYLKKEQNSNRSKVVSAEDPAGKRAQLSYRILAQEADRILAEIKLLTGRHHQIRVQMAHRGCPLVGDVKYDGKRSEQAGLALCANRLELTHPVTGKRQQFFVLPQNPAFSSFLEMGIAEFEAAKDKENKRKE